MTLRWEVIVYNLVFICVFLFGLMRLARLLLLRLSRQRYDYRLSRMLCKMLIHRICWLLPNIRGLHISLRIARVLICIIIQRHIWVAESLTWRTFMICIVKDVSSFSLSSLTILLYLLSLVTWPAFSPQIKQYGGL